MKKKVILLALSYALWAFLLTPGIQAKHFTAPELTSDRPYTTISPENIHPGCVQIEMGYTYASNGHISEHTLGETLVRAGVFNRFELRMGINSLVITRFEGSEKTEKDEGYIGCKISLVRSSRSFALWTPGMALILGTSLPAISTGEGRYYRPESVLSMTLPVMESLNLGLNIKGDYVREDNQWLFRYSGRTVHLRRLYIPVFKKISD